MVDGVVYVVTFGFVTDRHYDIIGVYGTRESAIIEAEHSVNKRIREIEYRSISEREISLVTKWNGNYFSSRYYWAEITDYTIGGVKHG